MSARNPAAAATATRQQPRSPEELLASMESLIREAKETFVTKEALENLLETFTARTEAAIQRVREWRQEYQQQQQQQPQRGAPGPAPAVMHEDRLLAEVPVALVEKTAEIIEDVIKNTRPGAKYTYDVVPRWPNRGPNGAAAGAAAAAGTSERGRTRRNGAETLLVDILISSSSRRSFASLGGELRRRHKIIIKDALTRAGVTLRQQRYPTFARLFEQRRQPRWENGVDITFINDAGNRVRWTEPWVTTDQPAAAAANPSAGA